MGKKSRNKKNRKNELDLRKPYRSGSVIEKAVVRGGWDEGETFAFRSDFVIREYESDEDVTLLISLPVKGMRVIPIGIYELTKNPSAEVSPLVIELKVYDESLTRMVTDSMSLIKREALADEMIRKVSLHMAGNPTSPFSSLFLQAFSDDIAKLMVADV